MMTNTRVDLLNFTELGGGLESGQFSSDFAEEATDCVRACVCVCVSQG